MLLVPADGNSEALPPMVQKIPANTETPSMQQSGLGFESQVPTEISAADQSLISPMQGEIAVGTYVKIFGTGGDGLRLRDEPGLGGNVRMLGEETEVFLVDSGPQNIDDYIWWHLTGYYDETRGGWAVADYLSIVEKP